MPLDNPSDIDKSANFVDSEGTKFSPADQMRFNAAFFSPAAIEDRLRKKAQIKADATVQTETRLMGPKIGLYAATVGQNERAVQELRNKPAADQLAFMKEMMKKGGEGGAGGPIDTKAMMEGIFSKWGYPGVVKPPAVPGGAGASPSPKPEAGAGYGGEPSAAVDPFDSTAVNPSTGLRYGANIDEVLAAQKKKKTEETAPPWGTDLMFP